MIMATGHSVMEYNATEVGFGGQFLDTSWSAKSLAISADISDTLSGYFNIQTSSSVDVEIPYTVGADEGMNTSSLWNMSVLSLNNDYNTSDWTEQGNTSHQDLGSMVAKGIFLGALISMTVCGNVLVLLAVFVNAHLRSTTHYFIANLAVADLLLGTTVLPFSATLEVVDRWVFGQLFCDIWAAVDVLCCTASIMGLCVISIDRYIGVTRPLQHSTIMTERRSYLIIVLVWVLSIAISVAPLLGWKEPPPDDPNVCEVTKQLGYVLFSVSGSFYIPLVIILVVYFRVYREALTQSRFLKTGIKTSKGDESSQEITLRIHKGRASQPHLQAKPASTPNAGPYQSSSSSEHSEESGRKNITKMTLAGKIAKFNREKKAAKTLGIVVGVFILCWFPFFFVLPLEALCSSCYIPEWLFKIIFWLGYCNSAMNPIIYTLSSREFKRAFIRILKCQWRRRPRTFINELSLAGTYNTKPTPCLCGLGKRIKNISKRKKKYLCAGGSRNVGAIYTTVTRVPRARRFDDESPISSLRLLHVHQRRETTMDTVIISDDESGGIHEESDVEDDECDTFTNGNIDKYSCSNTNNNDRDLDAEARVQLLQTEPEMIKADCTIPHVDETNFVVVPVESESIYITNHNTTHSNHDSITRNRFNIPEIIIHDSDMEHHYDFVSNQELSNEKQASKPACNHAVYEKGADRIMWL